MTSRNEGSDDAMFVPELINNRFADYKVGLFDSSGVVSGSEDLVSSSKLVVDSNF